MMRQPKKPQGNVLENKTDSIVFLLCKTAVSAHSDMWRPDLHTVLMKGVVKLSRYRKEHLM